MGVVIYNGISSLDYGIQVEHPPGYQIPAKDYESIHIPGRSGDLFFDNGSYQNVNRSYDLAVGDRYKYFTEMAGGLASWLCSASGYARLEDSYDPECYRMATFQNEANIENILQHAGRVTIDFNCKPQRFLKSGEKISHFGRDDLTNINTDFVIINPTNYIAYPIITMHGGWEYGKTYEDWFRITNERGGIFEVRFNGAAGIFSITGEGGHAEYTHPSYCLDCELGIVYDENNGIESYRYTNIFSFTNGLPKLYPGKNIITLPPITTKSIIYNIEIVPRWWTI